ncbi:MAG: insulinase family protein [Alphaproteobacteria bacterium]|nr:insulinase family protein [Alphaproteobacteria bacterium]
MNVDITRLKSGLTVITDPMPALESAAFGVWVNAGTRHEIPAEMGISHMLEHMAFKGTRRRTARAIVEEIEAVGGYLNAYTSRGQTAFHARTLRADVALGLDILADILTEPSFLPEEIERERQVVLQELGQARDTPDEIIFDHLQATVYPDQPMGFPILGNDDTVSGFGENALRAYMERHYRADQMVLIASGAVRHEEVLALAEEKFAAVPSGSAPKPAPARYAGGDLRLDEDHEQVHITFGFPGVASADPLNYVAQVYVTALGGGMSSRLFQEVREKRGLCYSVYAFLNSFRDSGMIGIYAGTGAEAASELSQVVAAQMADIAETLTVAEVERAKAQLRAGLLMGLERPAARAEQIAGHMLSFGRVVPVAELVEGLDAVDVEAVRGFAGQVIETDMPALVALGPVARVESYEKFAARFGSR